MTIADILIQLGIAYLLGMITALLCMMTLTSWVRQQRRIAQCYHDQAMVYWEAVKEAQSLANVVTIDRS